MYVDGPALTFSIDTSFTARTTPAAPRCQSVKSNVMRSWTTWNPLSSRMGVDERWISATNPTTRMAAVLSHRSVPENTASAARRSASSRVPASSSTPASALIASNSSFIARIVSASDHANTRRMAPGLSVHSVIETGCRTNR